MITNYDEGEFDHLFVWQRGEQEPGVILSTSRGLIGHDEILRAPTTSAARAAAVLRDALAAIVTDSADSVSVCDNNHTEVAPGKFRDEALRAARHLIEVAAREADEMT